MSYADQVRQLIKSYLNEGASIWRTVVKHSQEYKKVLRLDDSDLEILERKQGRAGFMYPTFQDRAEHAFLRIKLEDETFALYVANVAAHNYGGRWQYCVMAFCLSDINLEMGEGTGYIIALPDSLHQKLLVALSAK